MKILIADDHPLICEAMKRVVAELSRDATVLEAASLAAACGELAAHPDVSVVVLEIALDRGAGLAALDAVGAAAPDTPIVVLSARDDPATARAALECGARGFISKRSPRRVVVEALRLVLFGGTYVPPEALRGGAARDTSPVPCADAPAPNAGGDPLEALGLTPRQRDVLALLVQGCSGKQICRALDVAESTVKAHTGAILRALNAANRTQAICALARRGVDVAALRLPASVAEGTNAARTALRPAFRRAFADGSLF